MHGIDGLSNRLFGSDSFGLRQINDDGVRRLVQRIDLLGWFHLGRWLGRG